MKLLLASKSPRRRQLLSELGYEIELVEADADEHLRLPSDASQVAEHLAKRKAHAALRQVGEGEVLIAADTVVVVDGRVLGKPADRAEASQMLHALSGRSHRVYTGVCLRTVGNERSFTECTTIHFHPLGDAEINYYIDHFRPYDKAGSYGIQEWIGMVGVSRIEGCYYNVMGLPIARLYQELKALGVVAL